MTIRELQQAAHALAVTKGWYDTERAPLELLCLVHSELSEACECFRNNTPGTYTSHGKPEGFAIELADAVIRIADMCEYLGVDLQAATETKHAYNQTRGYRHGGKKA